MIKLLAAIALIAAVDVEIALRDESQVLGTLTTVTEDQVTLQSDGQLKTISLERIRQLRVQPDAEATDSVESAKIRANLRNGSIINAKGYTVNGQVASIELTTGLTVELPVRIVDHVVLAPSNPGLDQKRREIFSAQRPGDLVTIRRPNDNLDFFEGVLSDIDDQTVRFRFAGDWVDIRRTRIDALQYFAPAAAVAKPRCKVMTTGGSQWNVQAIELADHSFEVTLAGGGMISLPFEHIKTIDFASTATVYLSDLQPENLVLTPSIQIAALSQDLVELGADEPFRPRHDHSFAGREHPLGLMQSDGSVKQFKKGLAVHSRTELTYRLAGEYREFRALAGLDPSVRKAGSVVLVIRTDAQELLRTEIAGGMSPTEISLDVSGANRLTLLIDYGDASDIADRLNLCDARLIK